MHYCKQLNRRSDDLLQSNNTQPRERRINHSGYQSPNQPKRRLADKVFPLINSTMALYIEQKQNNHNTRYRLAMTALNDIIVQHPKLSLEQQYELAYNVADQQLNQSIQ